ncbi:DUF5060 domain-containing protein, partial [bacterium]|nr:DUF5060 domain-containing protein [bacterium]
MVVVRMGISGDCSRRIWNEFLRRVGEAIIGTPTITGEQKAWHTVTLTFRGPQLNESDTSPNPFLDYRLQGTFTGPSGQVYNVPGFFDGDGNGGGSGSVWRVRFTSDEAGKWTYSASFRRGTEVAISLKPDAGTPASFDGISGSFDIGACDADADGFLSKGRLVHQEGKYYLKTLGDGKYWLKGGTDSPDNFLAYGGFDNTTPNPSHPEWFHDFNSHIQDWNSGDPDWGNGRGKGIIGALNYLSSKHVNSIYVLLMNIGGDGQDVWPYSGSIDRKGNPENDNLHFDISKLKQWEIVFLHAQKKEINLQFVLNEGEEANKKELDDATLGTERKLYYREMIARFGHHNALQWNLCEEYDIEPYPLTPEQIRSFADYIQAVDPYKHPVTVHNCKIDKWEPFWGNRQFNLTSLQYYPEQGIKSTVAINLSYGDKTEELRARAKKNGHVIPVCFD